MYFDVFIDEFLYVDGENGWGGGQEVTGKRKRVSNKRRVNE